MKNLTLASTQATASTPGRQSIPVVPQQVPHELIVDLHSRRPHDELAPRVGANVLKDVPAGICHDGLHGVGLATASLAIGKDGGVVPRHG